jgi:hypothetical protein
MDKRDFLQLWKEIPEQNEVQFNINNDLGLSAGMFVCNCQRILILQNFR